VNAKEKILRVHWKIINIYVGLLKVLRAGKKDLTLHNPSMIR
jgi:hypothetical protein